MCVWDVWSALCVLCGECVLQSVFVHVVCVCVCVMLCGARGVWVVSDVRVVRVCVCALCFGVCVVQAACV